ncbi:MAG TPA: 7-carboxy-7-deazaguanine synthase QueE [Drouetiella sp.]|jgi:7-carboxy-7-deazaguanine synthase
MLGKNPVRPQELSDGQILWVQSVFYTLQGEGPFIGTPALFIRLAGCNLKCFFCDTDFESSQWRPTLTELIERVNQEKPEHCKLVVITGGEPFRQNIAPLVEQLLLIGMTVQIETNGTLWVELPEHQNLHIVCSPKTSYLHEKMLPRITTFKYVLDSNSVDPDDGLPNASTQKADSLTKVARPPQGSDVFVMPLDSGESRKNEENRRACVDVAMRFGYRLTLQSHKLLNIE